MVIVAQRPDDELREVQSELARSTTMQARTIFNNLSIDLEHDCGHPATPHQPVRH